MTDLIRESPFGQLVRWATHNKYFKYPEEQECFTIPWQNPGREARRSSTKEIDEREFNQDESTLPKSPEAKDDATPDEQLEDCETPERDNRADSMSNMFRAETEKDAEMGQIPTMSRTKSRESTIPYSENRYEVERENAAERQKSMVIVPTTTADGIIVVDWYTTDDPDNPQNWSSAKKAYVGLLILYVPFCHCHGPTLISEAYTLLSFMPHLLYTLPPKGKSHKSFYFLLS